MTVAELIETLKAMPSDARVFHAWDGAARTEIEHVWVARSGNVITADSGEVVYDTDDRPVTAPTAEQNRYWSTPERPETQTKD